MQAHDFEPMSIGRILDQTFRIYRQNFICFVTIVAVIQVPISLLMIVSTTGLHRGVPIRQSSDSGQSSYGEPEPAVALFGAAGMVVTGIFGLLGQVLCRGALAKSVSEFYLGNEISVSQAYRFVLPKFLTLILAGICMVLVIYLGFLLLVVPGIIFALWFALTTPVIVVENLGATQGMSRSKALASGNLGKIFSVGFLVFLIAIVLSMVLNYSASMFTRFIFFGNATLLLSLRHFVSVAANILIAPIGATAYILLYYDLRIRKEGFDLQMLADSMSSGQGAANGSEPQQWDRTNV
ncbi:MAG: hypothetical protein JXM79_06195 [Sedimentisphaerales bacterium]|nr:hypothetical protein [Sedimentisphaerales bacterium]